MMACTHGKVMVPAGYCVWCELDAKDKRIETLESLLMDALWQGGAIRHEAGFPGTIDTCALGTWNEIAEYFEARGKLRRVREGLYERV